VGKRKRYDRRAQNAFIDALRECLGLAPLHGEGRVKTEIERFGGKVWVKVRHNGVVGYDIG
jgi:uncharacterized protein YuzE